MKFENFKEINYFVPTTADKNLDFRFDSEQTVIKNREAYFQKQGLKMEETACMNVANHKDDILLVTKQDSGKGVFKYAEAPLVDAMVTDIPGILLMLLIADCLPMALYDSNKKVIALVHLSRETTSLKLAIKVINFLRAKFNSNPKDLVVNFGPHILKESYIMDLAGENLNQLLGLGLLKENITQSFENTHISSKYFSYRRSEDTGEPEGRFATIFGIKK